ncbi:MAG: hypothetical protein SNJ59_16665 [Aggregatilineales bacterium]
MQKLTSPTRRWAAAIVLMLLALPGPLLAQETLGPSAFYNSRDGFHILIPDGWENRSTEAYAHFHHAEAAVDVYAITRPLRTGQDDALAAAFAALPIEQPAAPAEARTVNLVNGEWMQQISIDPPRRTTLYTQPFAENLHVIVWDSPTGSAQPAIVPGEEVEAGLEAALAALGLSEAEAVSLDEMTIGAQTWTVASFEDEPAAALARVRSALTYAVVVLEPVESIEALPLFFMQLSDYFVTPQTAPFLYLGLAATALVLLVLVGSIALRARALKQEALTLAALAQEDQAAGSQNPSMP